MAGVPQYRDPNPDYAPCLVLSRRFSNYGPTSSVCTITYSDNPSSTLEADGDSIVTYDLMGRTETQGWDLDLIDIDPLHAAIGTNNEGASVYRPSCTITVEHLASSVDEAVWLVTGTVNDAAWEDPAHTTWDQYSLLFLGATIREEGSKWRHVYQFLYSTTDHYATWRPHTEDPVDGQMRWAYGAEVAARVYWTGNFDLLAIS